MQCCVLIETSFPDLCPLAEWPGNLAKVNPQRRHKRRVVLLEPGQPHRQTANSRCAQGKELALDSEKGSQLVGMALLRGLLDEAALRAALDSDQGLLEALQRQGSLDAEDLKDLAQLVAAACPEPHTVAEYAESSTPPALSRLGEDPWESLTDEETDGTGRQVHRVLMLPTWKQYRNLRFLAEGGMGRVFKAFDPGLKRLVALKFLRRE